MNQENIEKAVLLQGTLNGYQDYYSYQVVKKYPGKFIAAFSVDPFADFALDIVKRHVEELGFRAIKYLDEFLKERRPGLPTEMLETKLIIRDSVARIRAFSHRESRKGDSHETATCRS